MNFIESERRVQWIHSNVFRLILLSLALKLVYLVFACLVLQDPSVFSFNGYCKMLQRNDSGWYQQISENWYPRVTDKIDLGYSHGGEFKQSEWAFFPFYPWINRTLMTGINVSFNISGFIFSILFSALAFAGFYKFCRNYTGEPDKTLFISLLFVIFPFHYYFSMMYTEAIFFTFLVFSFIAIYKRKILYIPFLIIPLVLVRPNGIIALIPLYLYYLEQNGIISKKFIRFDLLTQRKIILQSLLFLAGPVAFILYGFYQEKMTGYFFAFSIAQAGWYRRFMWPFMSFFRRGDFTTQFNSVYTLIFILLAVISWKKFPLSLNILVWTSLLLPLFSGSVTSMPRFISVIFPFTLIIGEWLYKSKWRYYFLSVLFLCQLLVFYFWLIGNPFSS
jgi:hypothetical protein